MTLSDKHTHTFCRIPLYEGSVRRRDLYLTTQHSQQTDSHTLGGIRTHNPRKRAAADLRLRTRGHCAGLRNPHES